MTIEVSGRPHIPITEVPKLMQWPCETCPNRLKVAGRAKSDSLAIMDGELELEDVWVPEHVNPLSQRKVIIVQLGKKLADLYAADCPGMTVENRWTPNHAYKMDQKTCNSKSNFVLERLGHAVMSGPSNYGRGLGLRREDVYSDAELTKLEARKAKLIDTRKRRGW